MRFLHYLFKGAVIKWFFFIIITRPARVFKGIFAFRECGYIYVYSEQSDGALNIGSRALINATFINFIVRVLAVNARRWGWVFTRPGRVEIHGASCPAATWTGWQKKKKEKEGRQDCTQRDGLTLRGYCDTSLLTSRHNGSRSLCLSGRNSVIADYCTPRSIAHS